MCKSRVALICASVFLLAGKAEAQPQPALSCTTSSVPITARAEEVAALVGDVMLACTGGRGGTGYQVILTANGTFANGDLSSNDGWGWLDTILLVDEPSPSRQVACAGSCGPDSGVNVYQGRRLLDNTIVFPDIPLEPLPGSKRTVRIKNLRVNLWGLQEAGAGHVDMTVSIFGPGGSQVAVVNPVVTAAQIKSGLSFAVRTESDGPVAQLSPALSAAPGSLPQNTPQSQVSFNLKYSETFPTAFRRRNIGTSAGDPAFVIAQAEPAFTYNTETGFFNPALVSNSGANHAGLAATGTRLRAKFENIPAGVAIWVSSRDIPVGTTNFSASVPKALLTYTDAAGAGGFTTTNPEKAGYAQLYVEGGSALAVWEVMSTDSAVIEDISFSVALVAPNGPPKLGTATVNGSFGPWNALPDPTNPTPLFIDRSLQLTAFSISVSSANPSLRLISATGFGASVAPGSIASAFGAGLATTIASADPASGAPTLAGASLYVVDSQGGRRASPLFLVSPGQLNFWIDPATRTGLAVVTIMNGAQVSASGFMQVEAVAPSLFSADSSGNGYAVGEVTYVNDSAGATSPLSQYDQDNARWVGIPVRLTIPGNQVFVSVLATGIRNRSDLSSVHAQIGGTEIAVTSAGAQGSGLGVDQVNMGPLPASLAGSGDVELALVVDGKPANKVLLNFQ